MTYVDVLGHPTWVVDSGDGPPVLLLHGAFHGSDTLLPALGAVGEGRRVVAFDRRGHGRTSDSPDPFHYDTMADEVIDLLTKLDLTSVDVVGYSDGGIVALHLALRRLDLIRRLVVIGANIHSSKGSAALDPVAPMTKAMRNAYSALSPNGPDHFDEVAIKAFAMFSTEPEFDLERFAGITVPTMVVVGDRDSVPLRDTVALFQSLPRAQLAVIPGTSHHVIWERPEDVSGLVRRFLSGGIR